MQRLEQELVDSDDVLRETVVLGVGRVLDHEKMSNRDISASFRRVLYFMERSFSYCPANWLAAAKTATRALCVACWTPFAMETNECSDASFCSNSLL